MFLTISLYFRALKVLIIFFFIVNISFSQNKWVLNDALNFAFYQSGNNKTKTFALITNNQFERNKISITNNLNHTVLYNPKIIQNEFAEKFTFSYSKGRNNSFVIYQYNHSLVRKIENNHLFGIGIGLRDSILGFKLNFSYAILSEYITFSDRLNKNNIRNSFRLKLSRENKKIGFISEYYFQPNFKNLEDYTLYGTTKLSFKVKESLSFNITDVYNFFNLSTTPIIHNFTVGIAYMHSSK